MPSGAPVASLEDAVVRAAVIRAKPIALTALAAMIGAIVHPRRSHFQRARRVAHLRHLRLDRAHSPRDPGPLLRLSEETGSAHCALKDFVMAHVAIIGAGIGGVPCAYELRKRLGKEHRVTLIGSSSNFEFTPSNPWIAVGWRRPEKTRVALRVPLESKGVQWIEDTVGAIDASRNELTLSTGDKVSLRLPRDHNRSEARVRGSAGTWAGGLHPIGVHARARPAGLGGL